MDLIFLPKTTWTNAMDRGNSEENEMTNEEPVTAEEAVAKLTGEQPSPREPTEKKKKVGSYILGKTLGEGSFAKVRQGVHLIAHEKVRPPLGL